MKTGQNDGGEKRDYQIFIETTMEQLRILVNEIEASTGDRWHPLEDLCRALEQNTQEYLNCSASPREHLKASISIIQKSCADCKNQRILIILNTVITYNNIKLLSLK